LPKLNLGTVGNSLAEFWVVDLGGQLVKCWARIGAGAAAGADGVFDILGDVQVVLPVLAVALLCVLVRSKVLWEKS
jgi:hypothetical protein